MQTQMSIDTTGTGNALTPEKLRQFPGFAELSHDEAVKIIADLAALSRLLYEINPVTQNILY